VRGGAYRQISPHPLGEALPAVYASDEMAQRFTLGLDDLLAPLITVLDCGEAYYAPHLAPIDFVAWLGDWVGAEIRYDDPPEQLRKAVAAAATLHRLRGTVRGLAAAIRLAFGVEPEIAESGGSAWSARPLGAFPGEPTPRLDVVLRVPEPGRVDQRRLYDLVAAARPAHIPITVRVLSPTDDGTALEAPREVPGPPEDAPTPHEVPGPPEDAPAPDAVRTLRSPEEGMPGGDG
jgi:phage tail-like protein